MIPLVGTGGLLLRDARFEFIIDPNTPVKDLLPAAPTLPKFGWAALADNLNQVPEVELQTPQRRGASTVEEITTTACLIAKINRLNNRKTDGFLEALRGSRPDLAGLPFVPADACRINGERSKQFTLAAEMVQQVLRGNQVVVTLRRVADPAIPRGTPGARPGAGILFLPEHIPGDTFWERFPTLCAKVDRFLSSTGPIQQQPITPARIAALMQLLATEPPSVRLGLVKYLSGVAHVEATRALARLALFSGEDGIRLAAAEALKVRRERDYTDIILQGFRYPYPAVARRAADALVRLERNDLLPQLVDRLEQPDPRLPATQEVDGKPALAVRELVKINHHRNCLLCHAPGNTGTEELDTLTADVPLPSSPLPQPFDGYSNFPVDVRVRVDVTYLRPDFSVMQAVENAHPWPEMQRFDFIARTRTVTEEEAGAIRQALAKQGAGRQSPYQRALLNALRELTGKDTEPSADAWRRLLDLPARPPATRQSDARNCLPRSQPVG
jgi:hypothetical protein